MERESKTIILSLPEGKTHGFCEPAWVDDDPNRQGCGEVIEIMKTCTQCQIGECHMFMPIYDKNGKIIKRLFKKHNPAY